MSAARLAEGGWRLAACAAVVLVAASGCGVPAVAPTISAQPQDQVVQKGVAASFTVIAAGSATLTYQWQRGSTPIAGATGATYTILATAAGDDASSFRVVVSSAPGVSTTSSVAKLTVLPGAFTATGAMGTARFGHTATLLPNGKVLLAGGEGEVGPLNDAELFDPVALTLGGYGSELTSARARHTATSLADGKVLIVGGTKPLTAANSAEFCDPTSDGKASASFTASPTPLLTPRNHATAVLLANGRVLLVNGEDATQAALGSAELYDPASGAFTATSELGDFGQGMTATLLPSGKVLLAGGGTARAALYW